MSTGNKAKRSTVVIAPLSVDGSHVPDGFYRMSQAQTAECIGITPQNASNFLRSKAFKALQDSESTDQGFETIESDRNALLAQRLQQTEADVTALGEACTEFDALREQRARLEQQRHDAGLEPWQLPLSER